MLMRSMKVDKNSTSSLASLKMRRSAVKAQMSGTLVKSISDELPIEHAR